jgi:hypothetical protein
MPATAKAFSVVKNQEYLVCNKHLDAVKSNPKMWRVVETTGNNQKREMP